MRRHITEGASINPEISCILTINGGSSSIKFGLFEVRDPPRRLLRGEIDRIGQKQATLKVDGLLTADRIEQSVKAPDHAAAVDALMNYIGECGAQRAVAAVGHRVVHGKPKYWTPQRICDGLGFLGVALDSQRNAQSAQLISPDNGGVQIRVIRTDETLMIAKSVMAVLKFGGP